MKKYLFILTLIYTSCNAQPTEFFTDWPTFRGNNQRTGYVNVKGLKNKPTIKWKKKIGNTSPIVAAGIAYFNSDSNEDYFYAFDIQKQKELWKIKRDSPIHFQSAIDKKGILYLVNSSKLMAVNGEKGNKIWQVEINQQSISAIAVDNDLLYTSGSHLSAYDVNTGKEIWKFNSDSKIDENIVFGVPAVLDNMIYVYVFLENSIPQLLALDRKTGQEKWVADKSYAQYPVIEENSVLINNKNFLYTYEAGIEKKELSKIVGLKTLLGSAKGIVYVTRENEKEGTTGIYSIDLKTGVEKHLTQFHSVIKTTLITSATITNDMLVLALNKTDYENMSIFGTLYAIDLNTGDELWNLELDHTAINEIIILNNTILVKGEYMPGLQLSNSEDYLSHFLFMLQ